MTKGKLKATKRSFAMFMSLALALPFFGPTGLVYAESEDKIANAYQDEGYHLVWNDEFEGTALNTDDWNVETHEPGWVNSELQEYTEDGNIEVNEGSLKIYPKAKKVGESGIVDALEGKGFDSTWGVVGGATVDVSKGKATVSITNAGVNAWDVQFQKTGMTLKEGHEYKLSFKAKAKAERMIQANITDMRNYSPYKNEIFTLGTTAGSCELTFKMGECAEGQVAVQINLGKFDATEAGSALTDVEMWDATLVDLTESVVPGGSVLTAFDSTWGVVGGATADVSNGTATINITNAGVNAWDVQFQKAGMTLTEGHEYKLSFKAEAQTERMIQANITDMRNYSPYKNEIYTVGTVADTCELTFKMGECAEEKVAVQINLGKFDSTDAGSALTQITLTELSLVDLTEAAASGSDEPNPMTDYTYTSGRVNTQNKHDFIYGRFEAYAKVPTGKGYLPAFWLMATDEQNYGQWPKCGEIDIMEVMGQEVDKSYHTIHFGNPDPAEDQGTLKLPEGADSFADEFHLFTVDWEPGKITWYVDNNKVYETSTWVTGRDEESVLTYPAPFDQEFYIILNLAVGGEWVKYPDMAAVEDMDNQLFEIDYVRVYQKDASVYKEMEANVQKPADAARRVPDAEGNYVVNGDFAEDLKPMGSEGDNFELHLEADSKDTTYEVKNNELTVTPSSEGELLYSVQLKQNGIPMVRGWNYTLTYDAYADVEAGETRQITTDIKGPKRDWCLYLDPQEVKLTNEKKTYTHQFSIDARTDEEAVLEFNMGAQGSAAPVHISNIKLVATGDEITVGEKSLRSDGNHVYNGSFDQGEGRLGNWEIETENEEAEVVVTNEITENGRQRDLQAKVVVPALATELNPVIVKQEEIAPFLKGVYDFSFDAYTTDGEADGMKAIVAGKKYKPELTDKKQTFNFMFEFEEDQTREDSNVEFIFYKPGVYYLDNVKATESAMVKNGSFKSGVACYETGAYEQGKASYSIADEVDGHDYVMDVNIANAGLKDWHVQLKQGDVKLEKGKTYKLTFDAKASIDRVVSVVMQKNGGNWDTYSEGKGLYDLTTEWQSFENTFEMTHETDEKALFSVALGQSDTELDAHHVYFDNIKLVEVDAEGKEISNVEISPVDTTDESYVIPDLDDVVAAIEANDQILDLPEASGVTVADKAAIEKARATYDALTADQKAKLDPETVQMLEDAESALAVAIEKKEKADKTAAARVTNMLMKLPVPTKVTTADKAAINAARKAYNALNADRKALVSRTYIKRLADDEKALKAAIDTAAAKKVIAKIKALPAASKVTKANKKAIEAARAAYKKLTTAQKKKVTNLSKLTAAEKALKKALATPKYSSEWVKGKWYEKSGKQTYKATGSWHHDSKGWWFGDTSGWYAKNCSQKIDGKVYNFNAKGYCTNP